MLNILQQIKVSKKSFFIFFREKDYQSTYNNQPQILFAKCYNARTESDFDNLKDTFHNKDHEKVKI